MTEKTGSSRKLLIGAAVVIAAVIAIVLAAPLIVPSDFIAGQIAALVRQKTGRTLTIAGPIRVSLVPRLALVADGVALASPQGGFSGDFLTAKTVDVALKPLALLHGAIEIEALTLSHPAVNFEVDKNGERNWIFRLPIEAKTATASPSAKSSAAPSFAAGDMTIVDGAASYLDQRRGQRRGAGDIAMTVTLPSLAGPLKAVGAATYNAEPVKFSLSAASPGALRGGGASDVAIDLAAARGHFAFNGTIDTGEPGKASGALAVTTPSLRELLAWVQLGFAPQDNGFGSLSIDGKIDYDGAKLALADATIVLDALTAKGALLATRSANGFDIAFDDLAVDGGKATGVVTVDKSGPVPSIAARVKLTGIAVRRLPLGIAGFDALSGTGDVVFDLTGSGDRVRDIVASLSGNGRIEFANGTIGSVGLSPLMKSSLGPAIGDKAVPREIAFRSLSATATIEHGVLRNDDLKLAGPQVSATGAGTLDLAPRRIDYLWQPDIAGLGSARIAITGGWDNPDYKVESMNITKGLGIPGLKLR